MLFRKGDAYIYELAAIFMSLHQIKKILKPRSYTTNTTLSEEYSNKIYGDKVELKNSITWNLLTLIAMIILVIYLQYNASTNSNMWLGILFCIAIIIYPTIKLLQRKPLLTISSSGLYFPNKESKKWSEIVSTQIEDIDFFSLVIILSTNEKRVIKLTDLNYSKDEISHIIEYYKSQNDR